MTQAVSVPSEATTPVSARSNKIAAAARGQLYLAFTLSGEVFAIDIMRIREIIEYTRPAPVPMMPPSLQGVINVRGSVVPVVDLAIRFGWPVTGVSRRTSIVIVEIEYDGAKHVLGLVVDRVNAVMEIPAEDIESAPAFGARINADFISGMARMQGRFVIILNIARTLSIEDLAAISVHGEEAPDNNQG